MKKELLGNTPTTLERLAVERVCLCWIRLNNLEHVFAHRLKENMEFDRVRFYMERIDWAEKHYRAAVKMLAQVKRLQLPSIQVNLGEKQINVNGPLAEIRQGNG